MTNQSIYLGTFSMAIRSEVVSALQALTSDEFQPSGFSDVTALQALVTEYFVDGSDDTDYDAYVNSDEEETYTL